MTRTQRYAATCGALAVVHSLVRALTYRPLADGNVVEYAQAALFAILLGAVAWVAIRGTAPSAGPAWRIFPWVTLLLIGVPADVFHYLRLGSPVVRTGELALESRPRTAEALAREWLIERARGATVDATAEGIVIDSPPGGMAYVDLIAPERPNPAVSQMWLPRALYDDTYGERLAWEAGVRLENVYFVMLQTRQIQIQVASFGLHVTHPDAARRMTEFHVERPELGKGSAHRFTLERAGGVTRFSVDDRVEWTGPDSGRFQLIRFGETRPDALHGGRMVLTGARYTQLYR